MTPVDLPVLWFAWRPVRTEGGYWVWFQFVRREWDPYPEGPHSTEGAWRYWRIS